LTSNLASHVRGAYAMATVSREVEKIDVRERDAEILTADGRDDDDDDFRIARWGSGVPGPIYRFRRAGNLALSAGVVAGIVTYSWGLLPAWAGFPAGTLATLTASAVIQAGIDARRSAQRTAPAR
jgi:hypothetical protein